MDNTGGQYIRLVLEGERLHTPGHWEVDVPADIVFWTDAVFSVHGLPVQATGYLQINEACLLLHPEDGPTVKEALAKAGSEQPVYSYFRVISPAGEIRIIYMEVLLEREKGRKLPTGMFREERIEQGLLATATPFGAPAIEQFMDAGTWEINLRTHKTFYSANLYRIYDVIPGSLQPHTDTFRRFIHPDHKMLVSQTLDRALQDCVPFHLEYRIVTESGQVKWVKNMSRIVRNAEAEKVMIGVLRDISETRQLEGTLEGVRDAQFFQQEVLEWMEKITHCGHWHLNLHTRKIWYSDPFYRMHGLKPQTVHPAYDFFINTILAEDRPAVMDAIQGIWENRIIGQMTYRVIKGEGRLRQLEVNTRIVVNAEQERVLVAIVRDVTEAVQQADLIGSFGRDETGIGQLLNWQEELSGSASWRTDLSTGITRFSPHAFRLFGLKPVPGEHDLVHFLASLDGEDPQLRGQFAALFAQQQAAPLLLRVITAEGQQKRLRLENRFLKQEGGPGLLIGTMTDISQQTEMREQLDEINQFHLLLSDTMKDVYFITDAHHNLLSWNRRFVQDYGVRTADLRKANLFDAVPVMKHPDVVNNLSQALRGENVLVPHYRSCIGEKWVDIHMIPLKGADMRPTGVFTLVHDVTTEVHLQDRLAEQHRLLGVLLESTRDRIMLLDDDLHIRAWSKPCEDIPGLSGPQNSRRNVLEVFPGLRQDPVYEACTRALRGEPGFVGQGISSLLPPSFVHRLLPLRNQEGRVHAVLWFADDPGSTPGAPSAPTGSESITGSESAVCFQIDRESLLCGINERALMALAVRWDELEGRSFWDVVPESRYTALYAAVNLALAHRIERVDTGLLTLWGKEWKGKLVGAGDHLFVWLSELSDEAYLPEKQADQMQAIQMSMIDGVPHPPGLSPHSSGGSNTVQLQNPPPDHRSIAQSLEADRQKPGL